VLPLCCAVCARCSMRSSAGPHEMVFVDEGGTTHLRIVAPSGAGSTGSRTGVVAQFGHQRSGGGGGGMSARLDHGPRRVVLRRRNCRLRRRGGEVGGGRSRGVRLYKRFGRNGTRVRARTCTTVLSRARRALPDLRFRARRRRLLLESRRRGGAVEGCAGGHRLLRGCALGRFPPDRDSGRARRTSAGESKYNFRRLVKRPRRHFSFR